MTDSALAVRLVVIFIDFVTKIIKSSKIEITGRSITISTPKPTSLDERMAKIEEAYRSLQDGIRAIEELKLEAEKNKEDVERSLLELEELARNRNSLKSELQEYKTLISADIGAFRRLAGLPSDTEAVRQRNSERIYAFVAGIAASILASGAVGAGVKLFEWLL